MKLYPLKAKSGKRTEISGVLAVDDEKATIEAAFKVMDLASNSEIWAEGEITLSTPEGKILEKMPAK